MGYKLQKGLEYLIYIKFCNLHFWKSLSVTLFELMVANSWEIMEGYAHACGKTTGDSSLAADSTWGPWSRIYFLSFYLVSLIATTVITSFMLETFLFKVEYQNKTKQDGILTDVEKILLNQDEVHFLKNLYEKADMRKTIVLNRLLKRSIVCKALK